MLLTELVRKKLEDSLCLYHIGGERKSGDILQEQKHNISVDAKFQNLKKMVALADGLREALHNEKIDVVGDTLHKGWLYKKDLARGISNSDIDSLYAEALRNGAVGGKLLGAGGTGFLLIFSENHTTLRKHLQCKVLPFTIDREGTKIIFYE